MPWPQRRTRREPDRRPLLGRFVELVSATDYRTHYVADVVYGAALDERSGQCLAVCGRTVVLCSMYTPPAPMCPLCTAVP